MSTDIAALRAEITDDPEVIGYSGKTAAEILALITTVDRVVNVLSVTGQEVFEAVVPSEYNALSADQKSLFHAIIGMGTIMVNGTNTKAALVAMFSPGATLTALGALQTETVSRWQELGIGRPGIANIEEAMS